MTDAVDEFVGLLRDAPAVDAAGDRRDPERRRRRRRGWIAASVVVAVFAAAIGGYVAWALTAATPLPEADTRVPLPTVPAAVDTNWRTGGGWAIEVTGGEEFLGPLADPASPGTWASSGLDDPRPMASITKLVTALVILDRHPLADADDEGATLTFGRTQALYDKYFLQNATVARMPFYSSMTQRDVLEMMLIVSASNYAEAAAVWAYGSLGGFAAATEAWLDANGLDDTRVVEPSGIDPRNVSTPADLLRLGRLALADPAVAAIVSQPALDVPDFTGGNTNALVRDGASDGITPLGIKTGTLDAAGAGLLFAAHVQAGGLDEPLTVVAAVLGGQSQADNVRTAREFMARIIGGFHRVTVGERDQVVGTYETPWGTTARMVMADHARILTWSDTPIDVDMTTRPLTTGRAGEKVGEITWTAGTQTARVDLVLDRDIAPPGGWWRLLHPTELG